ncbi:APC family permease [Solihabitans fulvus]|uniref:APC family permease n=1 Tax=Solihabitans fulvus TaxID=1892852 RepID=A0A5B2XVC8_9PSEU|nr:APC family permease [Solihabitans fulvus]KAA2267105.1 APC family permease [Solihabitans fulvus]
MTTDPTRQATSEPSHRPVYRLRRGELGVLDIATSTMANIGPAFSFYFSFAGIVAVSGIASPLTVLVAAVAIFLLGNTLSVFSVRMPSTGSFVSFIGRSLGAIPGVASAVTLIVGYVIALAGVIAATGAITALLLKDFLHLTVSWQLLSAVFVVFAFVVMVTGVKASTRVAGAFFLVEMVVLAIVSVTLLITHAGSINLRPFDPANFPGGLKGLGLGFPLGVFLFVGWENSATLAEETADPRRSIPRAIFASVALMAVTYLVISYTSIVGFDDSTSAIAKADIPFVDLAKSVGGALGVLAIAAGFTSTVSVLIAAANSQTRLLFNAGRERLLPAALGRVTRRSQTPLVAYLVFFVVALAITFGYGWRKEPLVAFGDLATLGTIMIIVVYLVANLGLPVYILRHDRDRLSVVRHLLLPLLGAAALVYPLYSLLQPGQEAPFKYFPLITLAVLVLAAGYATVLRLADPGVGDRLGSIIADH